MVPKDGKLAVADLVTYRKVYNQFYVHLAQEFTATADADKVLGDFTECDFDGYTHIANPTFAAPAINGLDRAETLSDLLTWTAGEEIEPQTIKAVYVRVEFSDLTERLLWFKKLTPTVTLATEGEEFKRKIDMLADELIP